MDTKYDRCNLLIISENILNGTYIFRIRESGPDFKLNVVRVEIVEKCSGLSLAIKAIGEIMFCKPTTLLNGDGLSIIFMMNWPKTITLIWLHYNSVTMKFPLV